MQTALRVGDEETEVVGVFANQFVDEGNGVGDDDGTFVVAKRQFCVFSETDEIRVAHHTHFNSDIVAIDGVQNALCLVPPGIDGLEVSAVETIRHLVGQTKRNTHDIDLTGVVDDGLRGRRRARSTRHGLQV